MGFDVYGQCPTAPEGHHFRRTVFHWPFIVDLCLDLAPRQIRRFGLWRDHYRDGLNAKRSLRLANRLEQLISDGSVARYIEGLRTSEPEAWAEEEWLAENDIREFIGFLKFCGGFVIS